MDLGNRIRFKVKGNVKINKLRAPVFKKLNKIDKVHQRPNLKEERDTSEQCVNGATCSEKSKIYWVSRICLGVNRHVLFSDMHK